MDITTREEFNELKAQVEELKKLVAAKATAKKPTTKKKEAK
jgi:hypothetical protein